MHSINLPTNATCTCRTHVQSKLSPQWNQPPVFLLVGHFVARSETYVFAHHFHHHWEKSWRFRKRRMIFWNIIKYCCDVNRRNMKDDGERGRSRSSRSGFVTKGEQEEKLHAHRKCCSHDRTRGEENRLDFKRDFLFAQFPAKFSSCPRKLRKARGSWISFVTL